MKKNGFTSKVKKFNKKKFPLPEGLDYSGKTMYLTGWCVGFLVRMLYRSPLREGRLPLHP